MIVWLRNSFAVSACILASFASPSLADERPDPDNQRQDVVIITGQAQTGMPLIILRDGLREGRREAVLIDDWLYHYPPDGRVFLVPAGYTTDFASIPLPARIVADQYGKHAEAAVIHDWLYAVGDQNSETRRATRKDADEVFLYAMAEQEVSWLTRSIIFRTVRLFGSKPFGSDAEWNDNWSSFGPTSVGSVTDPPFDRPLKSHIATISAEDFEEYGMQEKLKFLHGTQPDDCSRLYAEADAALNDSDIARRLHSECFNQNNYAPFLDGIESGEQCPNTMNLVCELELWRPELFTEWGLKRETE